MIEPDDRFDQSPDSALSLSSFKEMFFRWRQEYATKLKEIHQLQYEARTYKTDTDQEILRFLKALIETLDSYDKVLYDIQKALSKNDKKANRVLKSFKLLRKQFQSVMMQFGAVPMKIGNDEFVSGLHKPVGVEYTLLVPEGHVIRVEKQGYYWKNQVLRPAEVVVASSNKEHLEE